MTDSAGAVLPDFDVAPVERCHVQPLDAAETHYTIDVDGLTDPENVELTLVGPMASGWVAVDGGWDTGSLRSLAASVVRPGMTDEQKALAIWELVGRITYRMSLHATSDPLELVNAYGYGYCSTVNRLAPALWQAAGLRARGVRLHGDYNCEVFHDGSWHLLSAYLRTYYTRADGDGSASAEELVADPGLVERNVTETGGEAKENVPGRALAACFAHATSDERDLTAGAYSPRAALRTRERLTRRWDHRGAWSHSVTEPSHYGNGELVFEPDLAAPGAGDAGGAVLLEADNVDPGTRDRGGPRLKPLPNGRPAVAVLRVRSPYPIVGGRLELYAVRTAPDDLVAVEAAVAGGEFAEVARSAALGEHLITADLGRVIPRHHGSQHPPPQPQELRVRLRMRAACAGHAVGVSSIRIVAGVQYHARVLPTLRRGRNRVRFAADAIGPGAQIVHRWRENHTLSWQPEHPYEGQRVTLRARVRNRGDAAPADPWDPEKTGVMVRFFAGEPRPENRIGGDRLIRRWRRARRASPRCRGGRARFPIGRTAAKRTTRRPTWRLRSRSSSTPTTGPARRRRWPATGSAARTTTPARSPFRCAKHRASWSRSPICSSSPPTGSARCASLPPSATPASAADGSTPRAPLPKPRASDGSPAIPTPAAYRSEPSRCSRRSNRAATRPCGRSGTAFLRSRWSCMCASDRGRPAMTASTASNRRRYAWRPLLT